MRGFGRLLSASVIVFAAAAVPTAARADGGTQAKPTGKGITGGALLGAEAVMLTEAAASVKPAWAYAVGGGIGAVAGGVGGYFAEHGGDAKLSIYLLVGGMALALPTTVAVLSASAYEPTNYMEDRPPADEPVAEPAQPSAAPGPKPQSRAVDHRAPIARAEVPPALVGVGEGALTLSVPAVEVRQVYTRTEIATFGVQQHTEVDVPVLNVVF
jgi:hypothetical protein